MQIFRCRQSSHFEIKGRFVRMQVHAFAPVQATNSALRSAEADDML
jgi:hypothetical protein